ncbi:hypothetical protein Hanom_Chr00s002037g01690741 [Helianthus anomalus]
MAGTTCSLISQWTKIFLITLYGHCCFLSSNSSNRIQCRSGNKYINEVNKKFLFCEYYQSRKFYSNSNLNK